MPPDESALTMTGDVLDRPAPALSATSDAVQPVAQPALSATEPGQKELVETTHVRDEKTGRFKTVDKPAETDETANTAKVEAGEPTDGDKKSGEVTGADTKPGEDKTDPATRAVISRFKAQMDAQAAEIAALKAQIPKAEAPKPQPRPDPATFTDPDAYDMALETWAKGEGAREATERAQQDHAQSEARTKAKAIAETWNANLTAFKADHPDYDTVTGVDETGKAPTIPMHLAIPISQLENGPAVEYYLGQHRDEADRIAFLSPILGVVEIGKIAAKIAAEAAAPAPKPKPKPAPMVPVGNRSAADTKDPDKMNTEEYAAWMRTRGDRALKYGTG